MEAQANAWAHLNAEALMAEFRDEFKPTAKRALPLDLTDHDRPCVLGILTNFNIVAFNIPTPYSSARDLILKLKPENKTCSSNGTMPVNTLMKSRKDQGLSNDGNNDLKQIWLL